MSLAEELLKVLDNSEEPLPKRIKIADNAFKSFELPLRHREVFLLQWILKNAKLTDHDVWTVLMQWINSEQFKEMGRNEVSDDEMKNIIHLMLKKLTEQSNGHISSIVANTFALIIENRIFQQYFVFNLETYCNFVSSLLKSITCPLYFVEFIKGHHLFLKNLSVEEKYPKNFLDTVMPTLVKVVSKFEGNQDVFNEISKIIQRNIFYGNAKKFELFLNQHFEEGDAKKDNVTKYLMKHLLSPNLELKEIFFKLIFHAFCHAYNDFGLVYKFFIIILHILGFDLTDTLIQSHKFSKLKNTDSNLSKNLNILVGLFEVLSENNNSLDYSVKETTFTNFIKNILKSIMFLNVQSAVIYKIFLKAIAINPLVIEPIASQIVAFIMMANNDDKIEEYESLVVAVFEVFAKLHRIENFIAKLIPALQKSLDGELPFEETYNFTGINDIEQKTTDIVVSNMFTTKILQYFTKCIYNLASWQVINLFKTFLFHLDAVISNFGELSHNKITFLEILSLLSCWLLQSVRMAEYTVASNVVEKFIKGLEELKHILKKFASSMLHRKHNCVIMRSFLNIAYTWGEVYITLAYYNSEVNIQKTIDNKSVACNLRYIHSYLSVEQWCSISERINNFGETHCKLLLQKLFVQKLRAMSIFEKDFGEEIALNVIKSLSTNIEETWHDMLLDKYFINNLLTKLDNTTLLQLAEKFVTEGCLCNQRHLSNSVLFTNAVNYVALSGINKLFKQKRKHGEDEIRKPISTRIFNTANKDLFLRDNLDFSGIIDKAKEIFDEEIENLNMKINEEKLNLNFKIFEDFPVIFANEDILKFILLYLFALHRDLDNISKGSKEGCEKLIIGILQNIKFGILSIFGSHKILSQIINNCLKYDHIFSLIIENIFKNEQSIRELDGYVSRLPENLSNPKYLECSLMFVNAANKIKKTKFSAEIKTLSNSHKENVLHKIEKLISKTDPQDYVLEAYAVCLKRQLTSADSKDNILIEKLSSYLDFSLNNINTNNLKGSLLLFSVILNNKQKLKSLDSNIILKIWNNLKKTEIPNDCFEDFSKLVSMIFTLIPNEEFTLVTSDLLSFTVDTINTENRDLLLRQLKILESIMACNVNPVKSKIWQELLENVLMNLLNILRDSLYDENILKSIVKLEETIIQAHHFVLTPPMIDMFLMTPLILMEKNEDFFVVYNLSISMLEKLLKSRNALIMDRLPPFLQQYRRLLKSLCKRSNSDLNLEMVEVHKLADCSHKLEKLTNSLVACKKDMSRISMYLVADILAQYEQVTLYRNVKIHLDNCVYSLLSLFDNHAVAYLMRVLSSASTEMFKMFYENYKKYYMFTGKV